MRRELGAVLFLLCHVTTTSAQSAAGFLDFLHLIDHEAFHRQLSNRCASLTPNEDENLRSAISAWTARNQPVLKELLTVIRDKLLRDGMTRDEVDARIAQGRARVTAFMLGRVDHETDARMKEMCAAYPAQLVETDYVPMFEELKEKLSGGIANRTQNALELPVKTLSLVKTLPDVKPQLLEARTRCRTRQGNSGSEDCHGVQGIWHEEFAVLQVGTGDELEWDLSSIGLPSQQSGRSDCGGGGLMKAWAGDARSLLYGRCGTGPYLIERDGSLQALSLEMPGRLAPSQGMSQYSISSDAKKISYTLYTRDRNDKQIDRLGRLYRDLLVQEVRGSTPVAVVEGDTDYRASLSPDGKHVAYSFGAYVRVVTLAGDVIANIAAPLPIPNLQIQEIRWSPDGKALAALISRKLYVAPFQTGEFIPLTRDTKIASVANLAWSPDGREIAFRSAHEGEETCSYGPQMLGGGIVTRRCAPGFRLYSANVASGDVKRLKASTEYRPGQLFWLQ